MAAAKWKLDNLIAILDYNHLQNDDSVDVLMPIDPPIDKWNAFGWHIIEINGHDMPEIVEALEAAKTVKGLPTMTVAHTVKDKGVSYMENVCEWHGKAPNQEQAQQAISEPMRFSPVCASWTWYVRVSTIPGKTSREAPVTAVLLLVRTVSPTRARKIYLSCVRSLIPR